jgi:division protein CdvB (Snf7/Vps24/ESCRT-III family)
VIDQTAIDLFVTAVAGMRLHQREFFAAASGSLERQDALRASKAAEKRVDEMIRKLRGDGPQGRLF